MVKNVKNIVFIILIIAVFTITFHNQKLKKKEKRIRFSYNYRIPNKDYSRCFSSYNVDKIDLPHIGYLDCPLYELINMIGEKKSIPNPILMCLYDRKFIDDVTMTIREFINKYSYSHSIDGGDFYIKNSIFPDNSHIIYVRAFDSLNIDGSFSLNLYVVEGEPTEYNYNKSTVKPAKRDD